MMRHRSRLSHLKGVSKDELLDHRLMEERLAGASVDRLAGRSAYRAFTYGWLASGLARAITGMGMRELIRRELAHPLNTDGLHLGRPPADAPTKVAQIMFPQGTRANPLFDHLAPRLASLPVAGGLGATYVPGITSLVPGDAPLLDSEIASVNAVVTARGLAKMYGALANDGRIDGTQFLSTELVRGLTGERSLRPDSKCCCRCVSTTATTDHRCRACYPDSATPVWAGPSGGPIPLQGARSGSCTTGLLRRWCSTRFCSCH
jgi:CubicO group peptidase (beta-lactamase class C family)